MLISRHTVDGARPIPSAIRRIDNPAASPREISSRSRSDNRNALRSRGLGRAPPADAMNVRNDEFCRPKCLAIRFTGTPASRIDQIVSFSSSENRTTTTPPDRHQQRFANQSRVAFTA